MPTVQSEVVEEPRARRFRTCRGGGTGCRVGTACLWCST